MANYETSAQNPWNFAAQLPKELEDEARLGLIAFLEEIDATLEAALAKKDKRVLEEFHEIYNFSRFKPAWMEFIIPSLGRGDVQIELHDGLVKIEETGIPSLWRMQMGQNDAFVLGRVPLCVRHEANLGEETIGKMVNENADVFAAPFILEELKEALTKVDYETLPEEPVYMVELNRQPMSPGDSRALLSTLGKGNIEVRIAGFAESKLYRTKVRGLWHSKILNNAGKELLDAYVCAAIPPEVAAPTESFTDARMKIAETLEWLRADMNRQKTETKLDDNVMDYAKRLMEGI